MITFKIKLADYVFEINTEYSESKQMCKDYISLEDSDFSITISKEDIAYERQKSIDEAKYEGIISQDYSDSYLETIAVYRKIAEYIIDKNATVYHGVLVSLNNEGYLFTGKSGIGKTTHVNNWLKVYPNCEVINGDKPILKLTKDGVIGYGTPWSGKEGLNINKSVKLKAIIVLNRDEFNHIEETSANKVLSNLLSATYRSNKPEGLKKALEMTLSISSKVKLYKLGCNMEQSSAIVAYEGMNK